MDFSVIHRAVGLGRYADGGLVRLVTLGPIASPNEYRLTSSSGNERQKIDKAHIICLAYCLESASDGFSIGFH